LPDSYSRYLVNGLREDFDMPGTPIRLTMRGQGDKNPYKNKKDKKPGALGKHLNKKRGLPRGSH
ncbi:MAG: ribosome biogenesis GTPase Der, partial [Pseudomonadota bacterium]|nr:ribosome biogenesis GTPase Der [Pseudomonadota bacterium]